MLECPKDLLYSPGHVWVKSVGKKEDGLVRVGLTHYYLEELPEILSVDLPLAGEELDIEEPCILLHVETGIEEVTVPLTSHVHAVNREVLDNPDLLHLNAYENWILELECDDLAEFEILVGAQRYVHYVESF